MRWEHILYGGVCGNECIRLMAQWECGMDELAVERLLQTVKGDTSTTAACSVYLWGEDKRSKSRMEERKEGREESECSDTRRVQYENSRRENIVPVSGESPWRGLKEDYSVLIPRRTTNGEDIAIIAVRWKSKTDMGDEISWWQLQRDDFCLTSIHNTIKHSLLNICFSTLKYNVSSPDWLFVMYRGIKQTQVSLNKEPVSPSHGGGNQVVIILTVMMKTLLPYESSNFNPNHDGFYKLTHFFFKSKP